MQHGNHDARVIPTVWSRYKRELLWIAAGLTLALPLGFAAKAKVQAAADARQGVLLSAPGVVTVGKVQVMAEVPGVVREVPQQGARVAQGQQLVRLEDLDLEAAVVSARLQLEAARAGLAKAKAPIPAANTAELDAAIELATAALNAAQKATDSLHAGMSSATRLRADAQAALNTELKAIQAKAAQTQAPHHAAAASVPNAAHGGTSPMEPEATEDCEVHQQLRELTRLFETITVKIAAADQAADAARDDSLMEQLMGQVETARINLKQALERKERTSAAPPPPVEDGAEAHLKLQQAQTALTLAERKLQKTSVPAPVSGTVRDVPVMPGTPVNFGQPLVVMSNDASTIIRVRARAKSASVVIPGQKALVSIGDRTEAGRVTTIDQGSESGWVTITIKLDKVEQEIPDGAEAMVKIVADSLAGR